MIPWELKVDDEGLLYMDSKDIKHREILSLDQRKNKSEFYASYFYRAFSSDDYIIKQSVTLLDKKQRVAYKNMLMQLVEKQKEVQRTEFPIGYLREKKKLEALIIRYYKNGVSFENILTEKDINLIGKYYSHDEDNLHNLFLLLDDVLFALWEMFENGINYTDTHPGNYIITDNQVKIIDFDPIYVPFKDQDKKLPIIIDRYYRGMEFILNNYGIPFRNYDLATNFEEAKTLNKTIENNLRRGR